MGRQIEARARRGRRAASFGVSILAVLALSACGWVDRETATADLAPVQMPERFVNDGTPKAKPGKTVEAPARTSAAFWSGFRSTELADLEKRAIDSNQDIAAAFAAVAQARANVIGTGTALLPTGNLQRTVTDYRNSANAGGYPIPELPIQHLEGATLNAAWEIDFWGKNAALLHSAQHQREASSFNLAAVRLSVAASTANAYVTILSLHDRIATARQNEKLARRILDGIRRLVEAGAATELDVAQQEAVVLQQQVSVLQLTQSLGQQEVALAVLVGSTPGQPVVSARTLERLDVPAIARGVPSDLLRRRPDVRQAEENLLAAAANEDSARAALLPSLQITWQKGFQALGSAALFSPEAGVFTLTGQITQPLFDAPRLAAALKVDEARKEQLIANYRQAVTSSLADVESAEIALANTTRQVAVGRRAVEVTNRAYVLAGEQLAAGRVDVTTVLSTQRNYFDAVSSLQQMRLARFGAAIGLYKALGGGWSEDAAATTVAGLQQEK